MHQCENVLHCQTQPRPSLSERQPATCFLNAGSVTPLIGLVATSYSAAGQSMPPQAPTPALLNRCVM
jgi:hypothetical protein